ncbi:MULTISPECIES: DUF2510 domain-containing protein [Prauserella salsuginis group]|uniref:DUF2510 domain-containing protein n=1 Tax=Prauserella salsuginis TaxID=387889 RepID=A0ABW6G5I4_9PSEU|nr:MULTISPECIES: DUF2510 domain-containing protein [Prauserella salsuginis group]
MTQPPPGWYPDQTDARYMRWWDGYRWTPYTQPVPQQPVPPQPPPRSVPPPQHAAQPYSPHQQSPQQPTPPPQAPQGAPQPPYPQQNPAGPQQPGGPQQPSHGPAPVAQPDQAGPAPQPGAPQSNTLQPGAPQPGAPQPGAQAQPGAGPVYTAPALHIVQDKRLFVGMFVQASYAVTDPSGALLGAVVQVSPDASKQARTYSDDGGGAGLSQHFELFDASGTPYFHIARALRAQSAAKPRFDVTLPNGAPLGHVESEKLVGRITMGLYAGGMRIGQLKVGGIRNNVLNLTDAGGQQVVECERKPPMFSREDAYNLTRPAPLAEPLGTMILAGIIAVDNAFFSKTQASLF